VSPSKVVYRGIAFALGRLACNLGGHLVSSIGTFETSGTVDKAATDTVANAETQSAADTTDGIMPKKQVFDQSFKDKAVSEVEGGLTAAEVARRLGLPGWLVQNWVRSARGLNRGRERKRPLLIFVDGRRYTHCLKFDAFDSRRKPYSISVFTEERNSCPANFEDYAKTLMLLTEKRSTVQRIRKGLYKSESGQILESDDPRAP
jgi:hypothetical protein